MGVYQLSMFKENNRTIVLTFKDSTGTAINITSYTVRFTVKQRFDNSSADSSAVIIKNVTVHSDPTNGQSQIVLTKTDLNIAATTYKYDIKYIDNSGNEVTIVQDDLIIRDVVTNR